MGDSEWTGLSTQQARAALVAHGPNALPESPGLTLYRRFFRQFHNAVIYILLFALVVDLLIWWQEGLLGWPLESVTILVILLFNAGLGTWQESKSEAALARLKALAAPKSWVVRDGALSQIPSAELVPADILRIEAGERIPADGLLVEARSFSVDESVLTGESLPLDKQAADPVLSGTLAVRGMAWVRLTATGPASNMGKLAGLLQNVEDQVTPLQKQLQHLGRQIALVVAGLACVILVAGLWVLGFGEFNQIFLFAVALAVAAVPESLPAVLTLAMAMGMERMARRNAVVRRLAAVEALGSVTVIATDKTGTLTENKMQVKDVVTADVQQMALALVLANDADHVNRAGDPLEIGLLDYAVTLGVAIDDVRTRYPRISQKPFDAAWKYMRVTVDSGARKSFIKGAPEVVLAFCKLNSEQQRQIYQEMEALAGQGYRLLALASGDGETESDLEWLGLVLLWDPPRPEVPDAIARAQQAGVRILMMTGDHPATAKAIAGQIGIPAGSVVTGAQLDSLPEPLLAGLVKDTSVFARVRPEHKLAIVRCLQGQNQVVAVTGDGVNDAPALKTADVGIAMGIRGSDVTREVADLVLLDDNFATIISAIEEGRSIYENIQKFVRTLFSTNVTEILLIVLGTLIGFGLATGGEVALPLTAAQVLWINLLTDSLPALAITADRNNRVLAMPPRTPGSALMDRATLLFIVIAGCLGGALALMMYMASALGEWRTNEAQTLIFSFLVFVQLVYVFPARRVRMAASPNYWVLAAVLAGVGAQMLALTMPSLGKALNTVPLSLEGVAILVGLTLTGWLVAEGVVRSLRRRSLDGVNGAML